MKKKSSTDRNKSQYSLKIDVVENKDASISIKIATSPIPRLERGSQWGSSSIPGDPHPFAKLVRTINISQLPAAISSGVFEDVYHDNEVVRSIIFALSDERRIKKMFGRKNWKHYRQNLIFSLSLFWKT